MTIVEKVKQLLSVTKNLTLQEIYAAMPEYTKEGIRGVLSRHVNSANPEIKRVENGVFSLIEVLRVEEVENGYKVNYACRYFSDQNEIDYFYTDFVTPAKIETGMFTRHDNFSSFEEMERNMKNARAIMLRQDAREMLAHMKDESVSLVVTDPPYRVISGGAGNKNAPKGMLAKNDGKIFKHNDIAFSEYISELYRVLKNGSHAYIFTNFLNLFELQKECEKVGFKLHNLLVWEKNNATPNRWYMKNCEYVLFLRKGPAKAIKNAGSKTVSQFDNILGSKMHETEKPINLLEEYILNSSEENDWILDPFGGSFSTMVAGLLNNRRVISGEIDEEHFEKSFQRLKGLFKTGKDPYGRTEKDLYAIV